MLYDSFNRRIRKPRLFGFGHTPASEPSRLDLARTPAGSGCDAIGVSIEIEAPDEDDRLEEIPDAY
jgi:hypothetical protein